MENKYTATSVRKLVDKYFSLQWCRDNLVVPLYSEPSLPMSKGVIKIAIANYSYLGTIASPIKERLSISGREVIIPSSAGGVAKFEFKDICEKPLAAGDYVEIADKYKGLLIYNIPVLDNRKNNESRRLINLFWIRIFSNISLLI